MAPAVEMKPSTRTGLRRAAAARIRPARPPISKPPTLASTSSPSRGSGRFVAKADWTTAILRANCPSSMPVPRPVRAATGSPHKAASTAVEGVVLAMPMSPVPNRSVSSASDWATSMPASMAATACSRVMAGPRAMLAVPGPTLFETILPAATSGPKSAATPMSTTTTRAPASRPRALIPAMPAAKPWTICPVTSCGYLLTPSAATP